MARLPRFGPFVSRRMLLLACAVAPTTLTPAAAAESTDASAPKDHLLFVGLDVSIPGVGGSGNLVSVSRTSAQIVVNGEIQTVTIRELSDVHTSRTPKVSGTVLMLSEPSGVRTYSPNTSPGREILRQQMDLAFVTDMKMTAAEGAALDAAMAVAPPSNGGNSPPIGQAELDSLRSNAAARMDATQAELSGEVFNPGGLINRASTGGPADLYDAYAVSFTVSAPQPIDNAFAVLIMEVRSPTTPNTPLQTVMFRGLPRLTPEPRKITIEQRGLPQGFAADRVAVHVFANGRELGTNLSQQSVTVTRDEAHQFLVIRHMLEHKNQTLAAAVVPDFLTADARDHVPPAEFGRSVEVHVSRDGRVENVTLDPALAPGIARFVENLVRNARFYPALQNGQPVEGPTTLTVGDFVPLPGTATPVPGS